jgi:hypothetical protein
MSETRVKCLNRGCENTILPATAKRTGGLCGPCQGKLLTIQRDEYIRQNRKTVDLYAGMTDPAAILRVAHQQRPYDQLVHYLPTPQSIETLYGSLTISQAKSLMAFATQSLYNGQTHLAEAVARHLAAFTAFNLDQMLKPWLALNRFWPAIAFRSAGDEIRDDVLSRLRSQDVNANHALQAVAWIGGDSVIEAYQAFDSTPPSWAKALHIHPSDYARTAAWEVVGGRRRELSLKPCFSLVPATLETACTGVSLFKEKRECCPWCASALVNLLVIDATVAPLSQLGLPGNSIEVTTCFKCTCFGTIFGELDAEGHGHLASENVGPSLIPEEWEASPWAGIPVRLAERSAIRAAEVFLPIEYTQIGGLPGWVQDLGYPKCHKCSKTMIFIAQVDNGQFRGHEGMYYAFLCGDCRTTATTYQQT